VFYIPYFLLFTTFLHKHERFGRHLRGSAWPTWLDQQAFSGRSAVFYYAMTSRPTSNLTARPWRGRLVWHAVRRATATGPERHADGSWRNALARVTSYANAIALPRRVLSFGDGVRQHHVGNTPQRSWVCDHRACHGRTMTGDSLRQLLVFYFGSLLFAISWRRENALDTSTRRCLSRCGALCVKDVVNMCFRIVQMRHVITCFAGLVAACVAAVVAPSGDSTRA